MRCCCYSGVPGVGFPVVCGCAGCWAACQPWWCRSDRPTGSPGQSSLAFCYTAEQGGVWGLGGALTSYTLLQFPEKAGLTETKRSRYKMLQLLVRMRTIHLCLSHILSQTSTRIFLVPILQLPSARSYFSLPYQAKVIL